MDTDLIKALCTGRLWLRDTTTGKPHRRATLGDVIFWRRYAREAIKRRCFTNPFPLDGKWCAFYMAETVGFDLSPAGGWPKDTLAKLIGVIAP